MEEEEVPVERDEVPVEDAVSVEVGKGEAVGDEVLTGVEVRLIDEEVIVATTDVDVVERGKVVKQEPHWTIVLTSYSATTNVMVLNTEVEVASVITGSVNV